MKVYRFIILLCSILITGTVFSLDSNNIHYGYSPISDYYSENFIGTEAAGRGFTGTASQGGIASTLINLPHLLQN